MPEPAPADDCVFKGVAASVRVEGRGPAVLTETGPFQADGGAARVTLRGAVLKHNTTPVSPPGVKPLVFEKPKSLVPVYANPPNADFDVTYKAGPRLVINVAKGGNDGQFRGRFEGAAQCESEWCSIVWAGSAKTIELERTSTESAEIASFTVAVPDPFDKEPIGLSTVTLENIQNGTLECGSGLRADVTGDFRQIWRAGSHNALTLARLQPTAGGLAVEIHNENSPERIPAWLFPAGAGLLVAIIAGGAIALRLRRRGPLAPPKLSATPPEAEPPANAPAVNILLVHASADDATCRDLVTHLQPLEARKRICMCLLRDLDGGAPIERSVAERMAWADVFLLAVSKNFFADEATCVPAMNRALERHAKDGAVILPVVLASFLIKETPLADFTPLPEQGRPVDQWPTKDAALVNIAEGVKRIVAATRERLP